MNRGLYPAPDEEPPVSVSQTAASLPRADAPEQIIEYMSRTAWNKAAPGLAAILEDYAAARIAEAIATERARIMDELAELEDVIMEWGNYYLATYQLWDVVNPGVERPADGGKVPKPFRDDSEP